MAERRQPITIGANTENKIVLQAWTEAVGHHLTSTHWTRRASLAQPSQGLGMPEHLCEIENLPEGVVVGRLRLILKLLGRLFWGSEVSTCQQPETGHPGLSMKAAL